MNLIKIGNTVINLDTVTRVDLTYLNDGVEIFFSSIAKFDDTSPVIDSAVFWGERAIALKWWLAKQTSNKDIMELYKLETRRNQFPQKVSELYSQLPEDIDPVWTMANVEYALEEFCTFEELETVTAEDILGRLRVG